MANRNTTDPGATPSPGQAYGQLLGPSNDQPGPSAPAADGMGMLPIEDSTDLRVGASCAPGSPSGGSQQAKTITALPFDKSAEIFETKDQAAQYLTELSDRIGSTNELWAPLYRDQNGKIRIGTIYQSDSSSGARSNFQPPPGMSVAGDWHLHPTSSQYQTFFSQPDHDGAVINAATYGSDFSRYIGVVTHDRHGYSTLKSFELDPNQKGQATIPYCDTSTGKIATSKVFKGRELKP